MAKASKTGFDRYVDTRMNDPAFAEEYQRARAEIDGVDHLIRLLDDTRLSVSMPKAELARRIHAKPEIIRRLFTAKTANPTLTTVLKVADALGLALQVVPKPIRRRDHARRAAYRKSV